jgi:hypothetical protein
VHSIEELAVVALCKVDLSLASLDVLEPYLVSKVDATDGRRGDHHLTKPSVEQ